MVIQLIKSNNTLMLLSFSRYFGIWHKGGYTADLGVMGTWEHNKDIGDKSDDNDDDEEEKGEREVETGKEDGGGNGGGGDEDSSVDVIPEQRKSNRQKCKKTK